MTKNCVVWAFWLKNRIQYSFYEGLMKEYLPNCDYYIGINNDFDWYNSLLLSSGLNIKTIERVPQNILVPSDASAYQAALKGYKNCKEKYDNVYFIHNKGSSHYDWQKRGHDYVWGFLQNLKQIDELFKDEQCGGFSNWGEINEGVWDDQLNEFYEFKYKKGIDIMWLCTLYAIKGHVLDNFILNCNESFFTKQLDKYFFEAAFPSIVDRQGYMRYVNNWWARSIPYSNEKYLQIVEKWKKQ